MARTHVVGALAALLAAVPARSQAPAQSADTAPAVMTSRLKAEILVISRLLRGVNVPDASAFKLGNQEIAAGTATGPVSVARGNVVVKGRVNGDVLVLHGDITVLPGGSIGGNAISVDGRVHPDGGIIEGDVRSIRGVTGNLLARAAGRTGEARPANTLDALRVTLGWFAVLFVIGVGVLLFAEKNLDGVVVSLEQDFSRSFWMGVLAQVAALPALLLVVIGLCVTIIGTLLVPFAVVAYIFGLAGLVTLGFIAVSRFTGRAFFKGEPSRALHVKALLAGLAIYVGLWVIAAFFVTSPVAGSILRMVALAGSWVAVTFGLGATVLTRAGTKRKSDGKAAPRAADEYAWQTPTPVTGVVAARRPVATVKEG